MNNNRCSSCGYTFKQTEDHCPYCGSSNPFYKAKTENFFSSFQTKSTNNTNTANEDGINICILIILLIVFWPAAIIYAVVKTKKE